MIPPRIVRYGLLVGLAILLVGGFGLLVVRIREAPGGGQSATLQIWSFALTALGALITLVNWVSGLPGRVRRRSADERLRLLADASGEECTRAADERGLRHPAPLPIRWRLSTAAVAGPTSGARYSRFDPLPGLTEISDRGLREGGQEELHRVYGGLPSGRLLLIGPPGSGKSSAAILLLLDALRFRERAEPEDRAAIPVPVLISLDGWRPDDGQSVIEWMVGKLAETYPVFRRRMARRHAAELLKNGRVAVFLDGLDEIPESRRPAVLQALADAPFRLVLLTRVREGERAADHGPLAGAVALELRPVRPADAAAFLLEPLTYPPPGPWQAIADHLTSARRRLRPSPLSQALTTPLNLSFVRDVYAQDGAVDELLDTTRFPSATAIQDHLLDRAIDVAYAPRPGQPPPPYTAATATGTLRFLATRLIGQGTGDLAWWHSPTWTPRYVRILRAALANFLISGLGSAIITAIMYGLPSAHAHGPVIACPLVFGAVFGLFTAVAAGFRRRPPVPRRPARPTYRRVVKGAGPGAALGFAYGSVAFAVQRAGGWHASLPGSVPVVIALGAGFLGALIGGITAGFTTRTDTDSSVFGPADAWRRDRNSGLFFAGAMSLGGLIAGVMECLAAGVGGVNGTFVAGVGTVRGLPLAGGTIVTGPVHGTEGWVTTITLHGLTGWIVFGAGFGVVYLLGAAFVISTAGGPGAASLETALMCVQLRIRYKTPLRLIAFCEDARERHLLRTVGAVYQFRHADLRNRLAGH